MSQQIIETRLVPFPIQSGIGYPTHISPSGTMYYDKLYGITYQNIDGVVSWVPFATGGNTFTGGTVTGPTTFLNGITTDTISDVWYIDFTTGTTNPSSVGGRVFFDNQTKALSYYDTITSEVPVAMGQQLYTRVWNASGAQIDKGKVITITGTSNNLPSAILATNNHSIYNPRPIGLAAEDIPNNSEGLVINNGILSGITLNTFLNGDILYLSDTIAGGYVSSTSSLSYTARTNEIGYVIETGSTTGKIYVNINNEDSNLSLTDIERNILEGNIISSGVYQYTGMTQGTGQTINVALARGWVVRNTNGYATLPDVTNIFYTGGTNIPLIYLNSADSTYILVNSASTLVQQTTFPTPQERRQNILLGKVVHPNRTTITSINQTVDFDVSPMAAIRDIWTPIKLINQGITVSPNGANLSINISSGTLWGNGIGWTTNQLNPDSVSMSGTSPTTFQYRSQSGPVTGATPLYTGNTTFIDTTNYDVGGVVTNIPGSGNYTTQRIYKFPTGLVRIQYGQAYYATLAKALAELQNENFIEYPLNRDNGILIGLLTVKDGTSDLSDTNDAIFHLVSKFGELTSGSAGISTTTLQQAYDNSTTPEIVINAILDGFTIKNGTGNPDATTHLLEGQNTAGSVTSFITADGGFSGSSVSATTYHNLPFYLSGTTSYLPKFSSSTAITDSIIYDTGTSIGIGETSPEGKLHVKNASAGSVSALASSTLVVENNTTNYISMLSPDASPAGIVFGSPSDNFGAFLRWTYSTGVMEFSTANAGDYITFGTGNFVESMRLNATGLGIGTTSIGDKLHVSGSTRLSGNLNVYGDTTVTGTTSSPIFSGNSLTLANSASTIYLNNTNAQQIKFYDGGRGIPSYNTYSNGAKIIFSDNISSISSGFAIGVDSGSLWYGADLSGNGHDWYAGTRKLASLIGSSGFQLIGLGSPSDAAFTISGNTIGFSKGGAGYTDFLRVINNATGATNTNKWFRINSTGGLEILNDTYTSTILSVTDNGIMSVGGGNVAAATSQDATSNYLSFNNNNTQIYDDGNTHIHSRGAGQSMWINTNGGQLNLLTQSPTATGGIGSGIAIATGTLNGYVTINTGRTVTTSAAYGYLTTAGAGTYPGGSQSISISLYANNRIWGQEIDAFSDERMKDIEGEIKVEEGLRLVKSLKPIKYKWKDGDDKGLKAGYSAQQVIKSGFDHLIGVIPKEGLEETVDEDGFTSPKDTQFSMNYDQVVPYHGVVIKHLLEKIDELEKQIQELKNK